LFAGVDAEAIITFASRTRTSPLHPAVQFDATACEFVLNMNGPRLFDPLIMIKSGGGHDDIHRIGKPRFLDNHSASARAARWSPCAQPWFPWSTSHAVDSRKIQTQLACRAGKRTSGLERLTSLEKVLRGLGGTG
jgi:hypothetical protein